MSKLNALLHSRKFWASVIGVVLVTLHHFMPDFPISDADMTKVIYLLIAYILGTGLEDSKIFLKSA